MWRSMGPYRTCNLKLGSGFRGMGLPEPQKVCKMMTFMAITMGLGRLVYILLGFR